MWEPYEVWISREEMVDFLLYAASLEASVATRSKMSENALDKLFQRKNKTYPMMLTVDERVQDGHGTVGNTSVGVDLLQDWKTADVSPKVAFGADRDLQRRKTRQLTLVDVGGVGLLARLGALLLLASGGGLLAGILLLGSLGGSGGGLGGGLLVGLGRHFEKTGW